MQRKRHDHPSAGEASLSAEDAAGTLSDAASAFCLEDALAAANAAGAGAGVSDAGDGATLSKAELLAQSVPFDAARALSIVQVRKSWRTGFTR